MFASRQAQAGYLASVRQQEAVVAAGGKKPTGNYRAGVSDNFKDFGNQYGPSQSMYQSWKKYGIPTSELAPESRVFGLATKKGGSAGDAFNASLPPPPQPPVYSRTNPRYVQRANPITWMGGPEEVAPAPRPTYSDGRNMLLDEARSMQQDQGGASYSQQVSPRAGRSSPGVRAPPLPPDLPQPEMTQEAMTQTWAQLIRSGKVRPSAGLCMVDAVAMQPFDTLPAPPKPLGIDIGQSINTIGIHDATGGRPVKRSTKFTSDFRDPLSYL